MRRNTSKTTNYNYRNYFKYDRKGNLVGSATTVDQGNSVTVSRSYAFSGKSLLLWGFMFCFFVSYIWSVSGKTDTFSFTSMLNALADAPVIPLDWLYEFTSMRITADWGLFNFFRDFLNNYCIAFLGVLGQLAVGISQLFVYIAWIIGILFGATGV